MKLESQLMTGAVAKLVEKAIHNKLGYPINIKLNKLSATFANDRAQLHLDVDLLLPKDSLNKLLGNLGL